MAGVSITLNGNFSKLDELKSKAARTAADVKKSFNSGMGKAMFAGVATAGTAAFAAVVSSMKEVIDAGGELNDMMLRTGASGKGLLVMERAFKNAGIAAAQVPAALNKMQKALAGVNDKGEPTAKTFKKLGLSIEQLKAMDPVDAFQATAEAIASIEDPARRTTAAMEIFGKSGGQLLSVMNDRTAFTTAKDQMSALANILPGMSGDLDTVGDSIGGLDDKSKELGAGMASVLLPRLLELSKMIDETDFVTVGQGLGDVVDKTLEWGEALGKVVKWIPNIMILNAGIEHVFGGGADPAKAKKMLEDQNKGDPDYMKARNPNAPNPKAAPAPSAAGSATAENGTRRAPSQLTPQEANRAIAASKKLLADQKEAAAEKERSRKAAVEEYNLESGIITATLAGDSQKVASLEREKRIREEMARLVSGGITPEEARVPAEKMVDGQQKMKDKIAADEARQDALKESQSRMDELKQKKDGLEYLSTVGAVSSMQRIGGGGGAVGSGLDYNREIVNISRQLLEEAKNQTRLLEKTPLD